MRWPFPKPFDIALVRMQILRRERPNVRSLNEVWRANQGKFFDWQRKRPKGCFHPKPKIVTFISVMTVVEFKIVADEIK